MTEKHSGEQLSAQEAREKALADAVRLVSEECEARRKYLEEISRTEEAHPIMVEGETTTGCYAQIMADPSKIAKIMLDYDFPLYNTLEEKVSPDMWRDIARLVGLEYLRFVDMNLKQRHSDEEQDSQHKN